MELLEMLNDVTFYDSGKPVGLTPGDIIVFKIDSSGLIYISSLQKRRVRLKRKDGLDDKILLFGQSPSMEHAKRRVVDMLNIISIVLGMSLSLSRKVEDEYSSFYVYKIQKNK